MAPSCVVCLLLCLSILGAKCRANDNCNIPAAAAASDQHNLEPSTGVKNITGNATLTAEAHGNNMSASEESLKQQNPDNCSKENVPEERPIEERVRDTLLFQIGMGIHFYYLPVIVVVGMIGNILTLIVMLQKKNRAISCCLYMANLAASDNGILLYGAFTWADVKYQLIPKTDLSCGAANLVLGVISNYNVMILVALTVDRFLAIRFPLKVSQLCTTRRVKVTMVVLAFVSAILTLPVLFTAKSPDGRTCAAHASGTILDQVHSVLTLVLFSLAPFFAIFSMNIAIIRLIRNRHALLTKTPDLDTDNNKPADSIKSAEPTVNVISSSRKEKVDDKGSSKVSGGVASKQDIQLTVMLVTVSFVFLLMILPLYIRYIIGSAIDYKRDLHTFASYYLILIVSAKTHITNSGVNFFLYCLSGSKFRSDVLALFGLKKDGKRKYLRRSASTRFSSFTNSSFKSESSVKDDNKSTDKSK